MDSVQKILVFLYRGIEALRRTVIYILGAGRSGTTLLDIILGNSAGILSCGELMRFAETQGKPPEFQPDSENYRFWGGIVEHLSGKYDGQIDFSGLLKTVQNIDYHRSVLRTYSGLQTGKNKSEYRTYNRRLFDSIFESVDEDVIVDSSKWPSRALALNEYLDYDIRYIYLVRNPVMVVRSFGKAGIEQLNKGYFSANVYYFLINIFCRLVMRKLKNSLAVTVRYEDLIENPAQELVRIQEALQLDLSESIALVENEKELKVANLFEGNRIRHQPTIRLHGNAGRSAKSSFRDRLTMFINGAWWRKPGHLKGPFL